MSLKTEILSASHISSIVEIEKACFPDPWSEDSIKIQSEGRGKAGFVVLDDSGRARGYIFLMYVLDEAHISNIAVDPNFRDRGAGDALMKRALKWAQENEINYLLLEVRSSNLPAIGLYEKYGFITAGVRRGYYENPTEDALLMTLLLTTDRGATHMIILSIETSCDETSIAVTRNGREILSNQIFSQADLHAVYGGVVPEIASRSHVEVISILTDRALNEAGISKKDIDAIAVTYAPGLIGALLVGVNFAKSAASALKIPLIPVHHIRGHIAANYIAYPNLEPPFLCLVISGGHSLIADVKSYTEIEIIGASRDDAAGECFDKTARVLGLGYPGGLPVDKLSQGGDDTKYPLPRSVIQGAPYDMSFSGLKTAVINIVHNAEQKGEELDKASLTASFCAAVSDTLVPRAIAACKELGYKKLAAAGGVAANSRIRRDLENAANAEGLEVFFPPLSLCGDNAAMIGCQGYYEYLAGVRGDSSLNAYPTKEL